MKSISRSTEHPIIQLNPIEFDVRTPDGKYVFVNRMYGTPNINEDPQKVNKLLDLFPRLNEKQLHSAKHGIYTWIFYSVDDSDEIEFVCTEVVAPFEIGTRHQSMVYNESINASKVYGAGELIKNEQGLTFNLLSGTYSKQLIGSDSMIVNDMIQKFNSFFPHAVYDPSMVSYIQKVTIVSNELLDVYEENGYTVKRFDTYEDKVQFMNTYWMMDVVQWLLN
jgi:hypothetical protein